MPSRIGKTLLMTGLILLSSVSVIAYVDIANDDPILVILEELRTQQVLTASDDGAFRPEDLVTRAEAIKAILASAGIEPFKYPERPVFDDVPADTWFFPSVQTAADRGIIDTGSNLFRPEDPVSKAEFLKLTFLTHGLPLTDPEKSFSDLPSGQWFSDYVHAAESSGIIMTDLFGQLAPLMPLNRIQMAQILLKAQTVQGKTTTQQLIYLAEGYIAYAMRSIDAGNLQKAYFYSSDAAFYASQAKQITPEDPIATGAEAIAIGYKSITFALHLLDMNKTEQIAEFSDLSGKMAIRASQAHPLFSAFSRHILGLGQRVSNRISGNKDF